MFKNLKINFDMGSIPDYHNPIFDPDNYKETLTPKTNYDLLKIFDWQISLLDDACNQYDNESKHYQALTMVSILRLMLHDTKNSVSLFTHLNLKGIEFNAAEITPSTTCKDWNHLYMSSSNDNTQTTDTYPLYIGRPHHTYHSISFNEWWTETVMVHSPISFSRKDFILDIGNKDGVAHVDSQSTYLGYLYMIENNTRFSIIRQITFEFQATLKTAILTLEDRYK